MSTPKIALVTGASRGLGRSATEHLTRAGIGVIGTYLTRKDEADRLVAELAPAGVPVAALQLDVADSAGFPQFADAVRAALAELGVEHLDYLVHNAGSATYAPFTATTEQEFDEMVRVHLKAPLFLTQALLPLMADGGRILNISSGLTRFTTPGYAAYAAAKGAVEVLTRYQAQELGTRQIRVNVLAPGPVATDFGGGLVRDDEHLNAALAAGAALGRVGAPDDIGAAVPAILSDALGWASGTRIELSGGQRL
jgi:NAD(P)-dependent dehydrogenase (short-subunit alcohol dehydrogenase family)